MATPILAFMVTYFIRPFNDHRFEFGRIEEYSGTYFEEPFPVLILDGGEFSPQYNSAALLVGYGKHGATGIMNRAARSLGVMDGKRISVQGTMIRGDGKMLIELTRSGEAVLKVLTDSVATPYVSQHSPVKLEGEIIDPKCWFGVMKPGEGKVHKSCAIRCISGGIPPVLRVQDSSKATYYLMRGPEGDDIHRSLLQYVGEPIIVRGTWYTQNGWGVIRTDPQAIQFVLRDHE
jgi:hypothetical protein